VELRKIRWCYVTNLRAVIGGIGSIPRLVTCSITENATAQTMRGARIRITTSREELQCPEQKTNLKVSSGEFGDFWKMTLEIGPQSFMV
jgi:hypothetical protein